MARKRRDAVTEVAAAAAAAIAASQADQAFIDNPEDETEVAEDVLEGLRRMDQGENRVTWYVYSQTPGKTGSGEGYIEKLRSEQLDEQRFKAMYGPGEYRIVGRTRDGGYVKGSHKVVTISDIGTTALPAEANDAVALLREIRAVEERRAQQRSETLKSAVTIMAAPLATIVSALIARRPSVDMPALITALRPQQNTLTEMTTALANLKQLDGGGNSHVEMTLKLLERLQELPSGGTDSGGWIGVVRDVLREAAPSVRELVGQFAQHKPPAVMLPRPLAGQPSDGGRCDQSPAATALPASGSSPSQPSQPPQPSQPNPSGEGDDMWKLVEPWLRRKAEDLHEEAAANMPVELSAEHLLTAAERKFGQFVSAADIHALLSRPDWWTFLTAFHAPLVPFRAWVNDVRGEILTMLANDLQPTPPPETSANKAEGGETGEHG